MGKIEKNMSKKLVVDGSAFTGDGFSSKPPPPLYTYQILTHLDDDFSCQEQLNRWPCPLAGCSVGLTKLTIKVFTKLQTDPGDLWPLRHLIRIILLKETWPDQKVLHTYIPGMRRSEHFLAGWGKRTRKLTDPKIWQIYVLEIVIETF